MAVVLPDRDLSVAVRAHPQKRDARGVPYPSPEDQVTLRGPYPGAAKEQPDLTWSLRLDPALWPMRAGDQITDGTLTWIAAPDPKIHQVPGVDDVDFIQVTGILDPPRVP